MIDIRIGPPDARIKHKGTYVQCPDPREADGGISLECRELLIAAVQKLVDQPRGFRMCLVWAKGKCTYVERNDVLNEHLDPPSGGFEFPGSFEPDVTMVKE